MADISNKIEQFYLEGLANKIAQDKKIKHFYGEAADHASKPLDDSSASSDDLRIGAKGDEDGAASTVKSNGDDDDSKKSKKPKKDKADDEGGDEETDPVDEADDAMENIDIDEMSNEGRLELIDAIIDSVQNSSDDDAFNDFMNNLLDKVNSYQYPDKEEEGDEGDEGKDEEPVEDSAPAATDDATASADASAAPAPATTPAPAPAPETK